MSHPDDAEAFSGGTIARLTAAGVQVRVVKMTSGGRGSRENSYKNGELTALRESEDTASMKVLGVAEEDSIYLRLQDGGIENNVETIEKIAKQIRIFKPDLVITQNPEDIIEERREGMSRVNHRDHRNTGMSTIDAVYPYSRDRASFPEHLEEGIEPHTVHELFLVDAHNHPQEIFIDITSTVDQRFEAAKCHASQFDGATARRVAYDMPVKEGEKYFERFRYAKVR